MQLVIMGPTVLPLALLFIAFTAPSIAQKTASADDVPALVEVAEGAPLTVECALGVQEGVAWRADGGAPAADLRPAGERALAGAGAGRLVARLYAARARPAHAALYRCAPGAAPVQVRVLPARLPGTAAAAASEATAPAPGEDAPPPALRMFELGQRLEFDCALPDPTVVADYQWFKNGSLVTELGGARGPALEQGGRVLFVRRAHEDDFGNYSCAVGDVVVRAWQAHAHPIARVPPNTNVVEGQKFTITCKLVGKPYPRVAWTYAPSEGENATALSTDVEGGRVWTRDAPSGVPGGVLEVSDALAGDAGVYACVPPGGAPAASVVRVKDVYAALWPFLGICLEVFILCAIILVYEKRRTKPELDDSDADTHDQ